MEIFFLMGIAIWWSLAVVFFSATMSYLSYEGPMVYAITICLIVFWPVTAVFMMPIVIYASVAKSVDRIRSDLHNRKVLREFEAWLAERDKDKPPQK